MRANEWNVEGLPDHVHVERKGAQDRKAPLQAAGPFDQIYEAVRSK